MKKNEIPKDVVALCEQIARGHERRSKDYERKRLDIIYWSTSGTSDLVGGARGKGMVSNPCAVKSERLEKLEESLDVKFMRAVEQSLVLTGSDVTPLLRKKLHKAILLNCENGREYTYEVLALDEFSRRDFYRRRKRFLMGIGAALGLICLE